MMRNMGNLLGNSEMSDKELLLKPPNPNETNGVIVDFNDLKKGTLLFDRVVVPMEYYIFRKKEDHYNPPESLIFCFPMMDESIQNYLGKYENKVIPFSIPLERKQDETNHFIDDLSRAISCACAETGIMLFPFTRLSQNSIKDFTLEIIKHTRQPLGIFHL